MRKTMLRLALAATAITAGVAVGLPAAASAAPASAVVTQDVQAGGDWGGGGWRHHRRHFGFGRFGFPIISPFSFGFGGFPFGFSGFPFGGFDDCWGGGFFSQGK